MHSPGQLARPGRAPAAQPALPRALRARPRLLPLTCRARAPACCARCAPRAPRTPPPAHLRYHAPPTARPARPCRTPCAPMPHASAPRTPAQCPRAPAPAARLLPRPAQGPARPRAPSCLVFGHNTPRCIATQFLLAHCPSQVTIQNCIVTQFLTSQPPLLQYNFMYCNIIFPTHCLQYNIYIATNPSKPTAIQFLALQYKNFLTILFGQ